MKSNTPKKEGGQAVAEFAAVLPIFAIFIYLLFQLGIVLVQQIAVVNASREAARAAALSSSYATVSNAATNSNNLDEKRIKVKIGSRPDSFGMVRVTVQYEARVVEPFAGSVLFKHDLTASSSMKVEVP